MSVAPMKLQLAIALTLCFSISAVGITIPTTAVGDFGNANDPQTGFGGVSYVYNIGMTEVTNAQYVAFLNAVAATDPFGLYSTSMTSDPVGGIVRGGSSGSFTYAVKAPPFRGYAYDNKPVVHVSWGDAARFVNWLNNAEPTGAEGTATTETGAYTLNGATSSIDLMDVTRNAVAKWFVPTENEWYKAAYYNPSTANYYDYPTGTNSMPNNNLPSSDTGNSANYDNFNYTTGSASYPLTDVGAYTFSKSSYGTFDQAGGVYEWNETAVTASARGMRGGSWGQGINDRTDRYSFDPLIESQFFGFRVGSISVPEPSTIILAAVFIGAFSTRHLRPTSRNLV
jgi:sulfatase modifying factor 1